MIEPFDLAVLFLKSLLEDSIELSVGMEDNGLSGYGDSCWLSVVFAHSILKMPLFKRVKYSWICLLNGAFF